MGFDEGLIDDHMVVRDLCVGALREIDRGNAFGDEDTRKQLVVGISSVDEDFESFLDVLTTVNPTPVIERLRAELKASKRAWDQIDRPRR